MLKKQNLFKFTLVVILLTCTCILWIKYDTNGLFDHSNIVHKKIIFNTSDLLEGDILFWKSIGTNDRAGHVAVISYVNNIQKNIQIAHATNNPKYNAFVETYLLPSEKLRQHNKHYFVIRIKDAEIRNQFIKIIHEWLKYKIKFNVKHEILMNKWDDSMSYYSTKSKLQLQHLMFSEKLLTNIADHSNLIAEQEYMCSEIIIIALQKAFSVNNNKISNLPISLKLDSILCPPSVMMLSLIHDHKNFQILGEINQK